VLVDKGVFTVEEYEATEAKVTASLDQELAKRREESIAKMSESEKWLYNLLSSMDGETP
jgi:hypothetical protein